MDRALCDRYDSQMMLDVFQKLEAKILENGIIAHGSALVFHCSYFSSQSTTQLAKYPRVLVLYVKPSNKLYIPEGYHEQQYQAKTVVIITRKTDNET